MPKAKVAIVHDWLLGGGAELVVEELHHMFPDAPIYTTYSTEEWRKRLDGKVITGWLQNLGPIRKFIPFLRIWWFSSLNLQDYDLVISSTGAEAKGVKNIRDDAVHVCYMHAPTHYYWSRYDEYLASPGFGAFDWLARIGLKLLVGPLRNWDYKAAQRPHHIIANSTHTLEQIKKYYDRDAVVIHPPIDTERFGKGSNQERTGFVITGRQTPYKKVDLAVAACTRLGLPLTVIGSGPDHEKLKSIAGPTITFLGHVPHEDVSKHLQSAQAFIFPALDDFGISAVEALAAGTPVIAYRAGGALDYVIEGKTGEFFDEQTVDSLCETLQAFNHRKYFSSDIKLAAKKFSKENFQEQVLSYIRQITEGK